MSSIFVLIMFVSGNSGIATLEKEFSSNHRCEVARADIEKQAAASGTNVRVSGCYKKD